MKLRYASLFSGKGTTTQFLYEADQRQEIEGMEFGMAIASNKTAIENLLKSGVPNKCIKLIDADSFGKGKEKDHKSFGNKLLSMLEKHHIDVVLQNGWMEYTPPPVIDAFRGNIFNQHNAPPEDFGKLKGRQCHAAMIHFRKMMQREGLGSDMWTEVVVQHVDPKWDEGAVVGSTRVEILESDSPDELRERALPFEHHLQLQLLRDIYAGKITEHVRHSMVHTDEEKEILNRSRAAGKYIFPNG